jgi:tetratricopeptide (TPR) repeat protein
MAQQKVEERFICVWLDNRLMRSEEYIDTQDQLRTIIKTFVTFNDSNYCVDFITNTTDAKIFLITSNILGRILVPTIHPFEQLYSIYIFHGNKSSDDKWTKDYNKIKEVFNDITLIYDRFKQDTTKDEKQNDSFAISFLSSSDISSHDVNRQDPSFMYFQLLKDIILKDCLMESEEQTKTDMLSYCRSIYVDCPNTIVVLDEFEKDFIPELSIYWYTKECFLYKMLNKALWTPQADVLYKLRYFLRHLYYQILSEASKQREHLSSMTVYRGQSMSVDQIEKLKRNIGGFLSFNNFLSTSLKRDIAMNFLWGSENGVLFQMQIDPTIQKFPFINIEQIRYLQKEECEQELLFAMGSVFRIVRIDKENDFYCVQLTLSGDVDEQLEKYTKVTRDQTRSFHSFLSLLRLMHKLGQYSCIDQFAQMLRDDIGLTANSSILAGVHHAFGSICHDRGQSKEALDHFQQTLKIHMSHLPANHPVLSPTYSYIGAVYRTLYDYTKALEHQQLALDCQINSDNPDVSSIITYTTNIASVFDNQEKFSQALDYYKRTLELQIGHFGENARGKQLIRVIRSD